MEADVTGQTSNAGSGQSGTQPNQPTSGGQPTGGMGGWQMPERFRGKSADEIARAYGELEGAHGRANEQLGRMNGVLNQWKQTWNQWTPVLQRVNWEPSRLAQVLEGQADAARDRGDERGAQRLERQAERVWHDLVDPREQSEYLDQRFTKHEEGLLNRIAQMVEAQQAATLKYINNYGGLSLRAIEKKLKNPKLEIKALLEEATRLASGRVYDPLDHAERVLTSGDEQEAAFATRLKDERRKWEQESRSGMTTHVGAGGGAMPYRSGTLRGPLAPRDVPGRPPPSSNGQTARTSYDRFADRLSQIKPPGE